jgi:putative molybdopterin biosynthesis protein
MANDLMTAQEVADYLKLKKTTVYEMIKRGDLPSTKIGKQLRISREEVEKLAAPSSAARPAAAAADAPQQKHRSVVLCGQDVSLDIIANYISSTPNIPNVLRSHAGSYNSLNRLYHGRASIATAHLWDEETQQYNLPYLSKLLPGMDVAVVRLFGRTMGMYVQKGNPKAIRSIADLAHPDVTLCNRETGSGTRILLDSKLKALGIPKSAVSGYGTEQTSHLTVAVAVSRGEADVGLGVESAAFQVRNVDFVPLQLEWYDMIFAADLVDRAPYSNILEFVSSPAFRAELEPLGNYDFSQTGKQFLL